MDPLKASMEQAAAGMQKQTRRIEVASENISNSETPGYRRKMLMLSGAQASGDAFRQMSVTFDETPGELKYEPSHPMADADGYVTMSNVSLVMEMADMREANRNYEASVNAFQQARSMYTSLLDILKR